MRMQNQVAAPGKQLDVTPKRLAESALDAIAFVGLADHLAHCKPDARASSSVKIAAPETRSSKPIGACG